MIAKLPDKPDMIPQLTIHHISGIVKIPEEFAGE